MRERINDKGRLRHILSSVNIILDNKDRFNLEKIESDPIVFFGFVKQLEIIGEAVYMLSKEFRNQHKDVEWDVIEGMARSGAWLCALSGRASARNRRARPRAWAVCARY